MIKNLLATLVLAVCVLLLLRLALGTRRRQRVDAVLRSAARSIRHGTLGPWQRAKARRAAAREAQDAIRRAQRRKPERDGNVIRPKQFQDKPRKPH